MPAILPCPCAFAQFIVCVFSLVAVSKNSAASPAAQIFEILVSKYSFVIMPLSQFIPAEANGSVGQLTPMPAMNKSHCVLLSNPAAWSYFFYSSFFPSRLVFKTTHKPSSTQHVPNDGHIPF